jgi:tetratricopeptide (TPR) repeat protein
MISCRIVCLPGLLALLACVIPAQTQTSAPPSTPTPPPAPTTPSTPSTPPGQRQPSNPTQPQTTIPGQRQQDPFEMMRAPLLTGRVLVDDGTPPPDTNVVIELVCGGQPIPHGYTDSKGRFSISPGQTQGVMADASTSGPMDAGVFGNAGGGMGAGGRAPGMTERQLSRCELRANLSGYRSDVLPLQGRRALDNPDVGIIYLHRLANVQGFTYSMTTANAPKDARKAFEKGESAAKKGKFPDAEKELQKAVQTYPKYAVAWHELGLVELKLKRNEEARKAFRESVAADPKYINPYMQLAEIAVRENDWKTVADASGEVIRQNPFEFPRAFFLNGVANMNLKNYDAAEKSAREAIKLDTRHATPQVHHLMGAILIEKRDYAGALDSLRTYLEIAPNANNADLVRKQIDALQHALR